MTHLFDPSTAVGTHHCNNESIPIGLPDDGFGNGIWRTVPGTNVHSHPDFTKMYKFLMSDKND